MQDPTYVPSASTSRRTAQPFPDEAALRCRSGTMALKGNLPEKASSSFRQALALNPQLWEAFEGLCALGSIPEIDEIFPPRPPPVKRQPPEDVQGKSLPVATGAGFFTPDPANAGNMFRTWKPDLVQPQPFRMGPPLGPRDSIATNDTSFYPDNSFQQVHRVSRSQPTNTGPIQAPVPRPLSSADEAGPNPKRQRSTARLPEAAKNSLPSKLNVDDPVKKPTTSSRTAGVVGKSNNAPPVSNVATRRSTRLLSGTGTKQAAVSKLTTRGRRRASVNTRSRSAESEVEEDVFTAGEVANSQSPPSAAQSPRSEVSPSPSNWTAAQEQAAQEEYDAELADHYLYNLTRKYASATRALATYDCQTCLRELEQLPHAFQSSPWVLAMVGRAHYEKQDFASAERAFKAVRVLEPHRLWDMEVYSTLLWHLQRNVELSFLAQELLNINPQSSQAWIAVGNLFSLQKDRSQALTCFRRAAQLDPTCAYAYTLSGHESIDEDVDKAINFFQSALRADRRHYNAWYGLGTCYLRMSKIRLAEYHYRKAVEIHPNNAVLLGCVGMAVERRGDRNAALALFNDAVKLAPDNALVRYRRAKILVSMRKYEAAVQDLEYLRSTTPEESNVIFQLARVYRLLGNETKSAQTLAVARDISPKSLNKIKKLLETVKDEPPCENGQHIRPHKQARLPALRTRNRLPHTPVVISTSPTQDATLQHIRITMSDATNLFTMARSKLHVSVGSRDSCSLHRWVLLKNSIIASPCIPSSPPVTDANSVDDDAEDAEELDSFMFPDAGKLVSGPSADVNASESEWLDSLLETLGDDDEYDFATESDPNISIPVDEDDDQLLLSPVGSPMSSSDDLPNQSSCYPDSITVSYSYPYPVPYPPFHPPLIYPYEFDSPYDSSLSSIPAPYEDPLPYHDLSDGDVESLSVPDAIEDTSDDESDAPLTPSIGRSSTSLTLDAASIPLPAERSRLRHTIPQVHVDSDDPYFYPFEADPLPFPDRRPYSNYQEC
ncbi:putative anaphase-promoting complex, cyclosome, subunit 3 [Lyophyllum shimeji]|uniref:Anaphase-promoting complex, cyclosome, subunit 3 n=1 Tax=Lyophyllum shimeji TaxID=47721 RepID=A0A9P3ULH1_LYOSH|nr:putative anaphase-promoting complex, cyclosome, subunit 3 [Lyophyllum shimeji]